MSQLNKQNWQYLGEIGRLYGLQGGFLLSGRNSLLPDLEQNLRLGSSFEESQPIKLKRLIVKNSRNILWLKKYSDRTAVEGIQGKHLWGLYANEAEPEAGISVLDPSGVEFGEVVGKENYGASDILVVQTAKGTYSIPFIPEYIALTDDLGIFKLQVEAEVLEVFLDE